MKKPEVQNNECFFERDSVTILRSRYWIRSLSVRDFDLTFWCFAFSEIWDNGFIVPGQSIARSSTRHCCCWSARRLIFRGTCTWKVVPVLIKRVPRVWRNHITTVAHQPSLSLSKPDSYFERIETSANP